MIRLKTPWKFAVVGVVIGFSFMAIYLIDSRYNLFRLPTEEQVRGLPYTAPAAFWVFQDATFVLCPASTLTVIPLPVDQRGSVVVWVVIALLNGPIYYCLGAAVAFLMARWQRRNGHTAHPSG